MVGAPTDRGRVLLVLHAHLPWVRGEVEERWLFEAAWECYAPLADLLSRLAAEGVHAPVALTFSPPLASLLRDRVAECRAHVERVRALADARLARGDAFAPALEEHVARLALDVDPLGTWTRLHREGAIELVATGASHGFLPALGPGARRAQVALGRAFFERAVGEPPVSFWLPECAFEPDLEPLLAELGASIAFVDAHGLELGSPRPPLGVRAPVLSPSGVLFLARDPLSVDAVWSPRTGYPGHPAYREFWQDLAHELEPAELGDLCGPFDARLPTGLKLRAIAPGKPPWDPGRAREQARRDAEDLIARLDAALAEGTPLGPAISVLAFDAELFGHFWWEGPVFLEAFLRGLAAHPRLALTTPAEHARAFPDAFVSMPAASTWGSGGFAATWTGATTGPLWRSIRATERVVREALHRLDAGRAEQLFREWLVLQASDWPFLIHQSEGGTYPRLEIERRLGAIHELAAGRGEGRDEAFFEGFSRDDFLAATGWATPPA